MAKNGKAELYRVEGGTLNRNSLTRKQAGGRCESCKGAIIIHQNSIIIRSHSIPTAY
jgi:hypothetical protein